MGPLRPNNPQPKSRTFFRQLSMRLHPIDNRSVVSTGVWVVWVMLTCRLTWCGRTVSSLVMLNTLPGKKVLLSNQWQRLAGLAVDPSPAIWLSLYCEETKYLWAQSLHTHQHRDKSPYKRDTKGYLKQWLAVDALCSIIGV